MNRPPPPPPKQLDLQVVESLGALSLADKMTAVMNRPLPPLPEQLDIVEGLGALSLASEIPVITNKPLPPPPEQLDLIESLGALSLEANLSHPTGQQDYQATFIGGFDPRLLASSTNRPAGSPETKVPSVPSPKQTAAPQTGKQSLTLQYALNAPRPNPPTKSALAPLFTLAFPQPHPDVIVSPRTAPKPSLPVGTGLRPPTFNVISGKPRSVSSPVTISSGKNTIQCSGTTKAGKQCSRQVKPPATHTYLDPTPVLYCYQHKKDMITDQPGFYVRKAGNAERYVEFSHYIPKYLQTDTQWALKVEMEKAVSSADVPGYIYTFEIRDPKRPDMIQLKVGRAVNLNKRLHEWDKQCDSTIKITRGWWPGTVEDDDGTDQSLLKGNIRAGDPGPFCHRVERLVHIELMDLALYAPYLNPGWPNNTSDPASTLSKKTIANSTTCPDCGVVHREVFTFSRPESGRYKGREWDLIVKPVIEKWGKFVKEYYT